MALALAAAAVGGLVLGWRLNAVAAWFGAVCWSANAPAVAILTAALFAAVAAAHQDDGPGLALGLVLVAFLVPLALIDLELRILPNRLTAAAAVLGLALGIALDLDGEAERLVAAAAAGGFFLVAALIKPHGMGIGDVKLAGVLGLFLGREVAVALFVGLLAGVLVGAIIVSRKGIAEGRKTGVPFGPFLALGGVVAVLAGEPLVDAYRSMF